MFRARVDNLNLFPALPGRGSCTLEIENSLVEAKNTNKDSVKFVLGYSLARARVAEMFGKADTEVAI